MKAKLKAIPKTTVRIYSSDLHYLKILAAVDNTLTIDAIAKLVKDAVMQNPQLQKIINNNIHGAVDRILE